MKSFRKDLACNITLIFVLVCTATHLVLVTLNLFGVTELAFAEGFNYILAYVLIALCLMLYIFGFFISSIKRLEFPAWLRIVLYFAFFIFTNTYYVLGWHQNIIALVFMFLYIGFCVNIISLSVFYNAQKDDYNRLKSTRKFIITSVFFYSAGACGIIEFFVTGIKSIFFSNYVTSTLLYFVAEMSALLTITIVMSIIFYVSLSKRKVIVNKSLIKIARKNTIQRSVKSKNK